MAETLESFVAKLQAEGVQAGRQEAEKIRREAQAQAQDILAQARREAKALLDAAEAQARQEQSRAQTETQLAARDTVLRLRDGLNQALRAALERGAKNALADADFLGKLIHELVVAYTGADLEGRSTLDINVTPQMRQKLADWALHEIREEALRRSQSTVNLTDTLRQEGFELHVAGSVIEVTLESVTSTLMELVSPAMAEVLQKAMSQDKS
jgi:V/A-type H+-transporting ATPase subunit E